MNFAGQDAVHGSAFSHLLSPFALAGVTLRNRTVFQPHLTALGDLNGMPTDDLAAYHEERARGGVGLIVTESQAIHATGKISRGFSNAWDPAIIPGLGKVAAGVHAYGARILRSSPTAATPRSSTRRISCGRRPKCRNPRAISAPRRSTTKTSAPSSLASASARNAIVAGFDGIEIKIAHDGLLRSFASAFFNHRTDACGGSFENRMRLSCEVLEAIRKAIGARPLGVRVCLDEFTAFGYDLDYGLRMVRALEATGLVDYFNSDPGSFSSYWMEIPPAAVGPEVFDRLNRASKAATKLPVVAFGRITPLRRAEELLKGAHADLIGWARQLIADPHTANKLAMGRPILCGPALPATMAASIRWARKRAFAAFTIPARAANSGSTTA